MLLFRDENQILIHLRVKTKMLVQRKAKNLRPISFYHAPEVLCNNDRSGSVFSLGVRCNIAMFQMSYSHKQKLS